VARQLRPQWLRGDEKQGWGPAPGAGTLSSALLTAAALVWILACLWFPLTDTDIWWHLASAKLMWARKAFLRQDPFCLASLGAPWADLHWGFQCVAYAAWKAGGAKALVAGKCLAVAGALGFSLKPHLDRRTLPWLVPLAAFGVYHTRFFIDVRPLALTLLGLGIQYSAAQAFLRGGLRRPWLVMVPVQIAMVNIQGLYPLGAWLVTCLTLGEFLKRGKSAAAGLRPLAWTCAALWSAGLISPYGLSGFKLPLSLLGRIAPVSSNIFSSQIAENLPFPDLLRHHPGQALPFLFLGLVVLYSFDRARAHTSPGHLLLFISFAGLGWMAQRNLPLAFLAGLMAAGRNLQVSMRALPGEAGAVPEGKGRLPSRRSPLPELAGYLDRLRPFAGWAGLAAVVLLYGNRVRAAWEYELPGNMETPFRFPAPAVAYLEAHPLPGMIFNELRYGGYLEFRLYPEKLSFVDGRMILRSADFYRDFLAVVDHPEGFAAYAARFGFTHCLLPISEDQRFLPLAAHLVRENGWRLLHCDGASVLLADPETFAAVQPPVLPIKAAIHERFGANSRLESMAVQNAAGFLRAAGRDGAADTLCAGPGNLIVSPHPFPRRIP
jgi:hypothetical protein